MSFEHYFESVFENSKGIKVLDNIYEICASSTCQISAQMLYVKF